MTISVWFFGSPQEAVPVLKTLVEDKEIKVTAVVTQPDRPVGRKKIMTPTAVKKYALDQGLKVFDPREFDEGVYWELENLTRPQDHKTTRPAKQGNNRIKTAQDDLTKPDLAILAAYGSILPHRLLELPRYGFLNLHPSLLPAYRGASPCVPPILKGEEKTGLTFTQMDEAMDHGPIVAQFEEKVRDDDTHRSLEERLFKMGAFILPVVVKEYVSWLSKVEAEGQHKSGLTDPLRLRSTSLSEETLLFFPPKQQEHERASFTKLLGKEDGFLPWGVVEAAMNQNPEVIKLFPGKLQPWLSKYHFPEDLPVVVERFIRALSPWPGAWTEIGIKNQELGIRNNVQRLKLLSAHLDHETTRPRDHETNWKLVLDTVRLEGRKTMNWNEFKKIYIN